MDYYSWSWVCEKNNDLLFFWSTIRKNLATGQKPKSACLKCLIKVAKPQQKQSLPTTWFTHVKLSGRTFFLCQSVNGHILILVIKFCGLNFHSTVVMQCFHATSSVLVLWTIPYQRFCWNRFSRQRFWHTLGNNVLLR